jgi:hypothetical protein
MDTLYVPLIAPSRMADYQAGDFALAAAADGALEITYTPQKHADLEIYMPAQGLVFYLPAGSPAMLPGGPSLTPAANALAVQVLSMNEVLAEIGPASATPASFAPWWVIEGVDDTSFLKFVKSDGAEETAQSNARHYLKVQDFRAALLLGQTSFNVSCQDGAGLPVAEPMAIASLDGRPGDALTLRLATYYGWQTAPTQPTQYSPMPATCSLAAMGLLNPAWAAHPLVAQAGSALLAADLDFHVAFQYWAPNDPWPPAALTKETDKGSFKPLPQGTAVYLMKLLRADPDQRMVVASGALDAAGRVEFAPGAADPYAVARASLAIDAATEVFAFMVAAPPDPLVTQYQRDSTPREPPARLGWRTGIATPWTEAWLTYGLTAATGQPGTLAGLDTLPAASFGLPLAPVVYNVGIPVFLQIVHARLLSAARVYSSTDERAPKGVKVSVRNSGGTDLGLFRTDEHGQIWGLLTQWDPKDPAIRVIVHYEMEDRPPFGHYPLALPRITGLVDSAVAPIAPDHFDSGWTDHLVPGGGTTFGYSGVYSGASLGNPTPGAVHAAGLQVVRIGSIQVSPAKYDLVDAAGNRLLGEHGGLMDAFRTLRRAHEWWFQLTATVASLIADPADADDVALKVPWGTLFDGLHRPAPGDAGLVVHVVPNPDVTIRGGTDVVAGSDRFQIKLHFPDSWDQAQVNKYNQILPTVELALLWNRSTPHHEFAHVVLLLAAQLNAGNAPALAAGKGAYNSGYDVRQIEKDTFTPLLEGLSNFVTLGVASNQQTFDGYAFLRVPGNPTQVFNFDKDLPPDLPINANPNPRGNPLLGLWIPGALASAFWDLLGLAAPPLATIADPAKAISDPDKTDLRDDLPSISDPIVGRLFQRLVWLPMRALRTPDDPPRGRWDDTAGPRAYPNTFSLMQHLATDPDCYPALSAADQARVRDIFGTALPDAWALWSAWPP